jgi:anti-anti-sigma factor
MGGQFNGSGVTAPPGRGGFDLQQTSVDQVVVISVFGTLDMLTTPQLADAIDAVSGKMPAGLIVDLSNVEFLASAGMNALVEAHRKMTPAAKFGVVADSPATSRPLRLIGVDQVVDLYRTVDAALEAWTAA